MRRIGVLFLILVSIFAIADARISLLNFITADLLNGNFDYFPILYVNYSPSPDLDFRIVQYGSPYLTNDANQYYLRYKTDLLTIDLGKGRLKRTNTEMLDLLRVGGLKYYFTGVGGWIHLKLFEIGGAYDFSRKTYAVYGNAGFGGIKLGAYYETKHDEISADLKADFGRFKIWGAVSSKMDEISNPSYLVGGSISFNPFRISTQYAWKGSGYVDYITGDPNENAGLWSSDVKIDYLSEIFGFKPSIWIKYNSRWFTKGYAPLTYLELSKEDLSIRIKLLGDDLDSKLDGDQTLLVKWKLFFDVFNTRGVVSAQKTPGKITKESAKAVTTLEVKKVGPTGLLKLKGVVTVPPNILGKNQFYIADPTGGILVYVPNGAPKLEVGEIVVVEGRYKLYYDMPEIVASKVERTGQKAKRIVAKKIKGAPTKDMLGNLVKIEGVVVRKGRDFFEVQTKDDLVLKVYIKRSTNISIYNLKQGDKVEVTGILYIYKKKFEILPRFVEDIVIK